MRNYEMRNYIANYDYSHYGAYSAEIEFTSSHRANSKANYEDAMREIKRKKERGIASSAIIRNTYLID